MSPSVNLRVSRNERPIASPTYSHQALQIDPNEIETRDEHVAEVIASQGSTVLDVQHVGQVRGRRRRASGWLALGGLMLLTGAGVVASEVGQDWAGYRAAHQEATAAGRPVPTAPGHGLGGLGFGLALLGLVPFGLGVVRRNDAGLDRYTLGESPEASFPVSADTLPDGDVFGLVQRQGDRYALCFTSRMRGEVHWSGHTFGLDALVAQGHTVPTASGYSFMLPDGARCRIEHEGITYRIGTVARGKTIADTHDADKPFWLYNAGSFAVMGTLLALVHLVPEDALAMSLDEDAAENRFVGYLQQPDLSEDEEDEDLAQSDLPELTDAEASGETGQAHAGPSGAMGDPKTPQSSGRVAIKGPRHSVPQLSRMYDPVVSSREAGILGVMSEYSGNILASPTSSSYMVGSDDSTVWGGLAGRDVGGSFGVGGLGLEGTGRQGGGTAQGIIGYGTSDLIGKPGTGSGGDRYGGGGSTIKHTPRTTKTPRVRQGKDEITGSIDKDAIRRIVRNHINQVRHCYNQGLLGDPNMRGRVAVRFSIGPVGKVVSAVVIDNTLGDRDVGTCVSKAVRRWTFPKPKGSSSAMVTYPFAFSPG